MRMMKIMTMTMIMMTMMMIKMMLELTLPGAVQGVQRVHALLVLHE